MSWVLAIALALAALGAAIFVLKAPRGAWTAIAAALLLGLCGFAAQGRHGLAGAPKAPPGSVSDADSAQMVEARRLLAKDKMIPADKWLVIGDAFARNGQFGDAATVLLGAVKHDPNNAEAWLAMANALAAHADGTISPASLYAYRKAAAAAPGHPGPPFFLGLALAQSGKLAEARAMWADLLARTPPDAPWRKDLEVRLQELDTFIARQAAASS